MSNITKKSKDQSAGKAAGSRAFLCLEDLLACYGRLTPDSNAILAPGRPPVSYGVLWARTNSAIRTLRKLGVGPSDRVAVVLPNGQEAAVAMIGVAAGAVCVPLNPGFTADECQRYFRNLRISALLTGADRDSASRAIASHLGIPVLDLSCSEDYCASTLVGPATGGNVSGALAANAGDAFILLTSGSSSHPKMVPLTHAAVCLSAYNVGSTLGLEPCDRLLNVLPLFHVHGLVSGLLAALAVGSSVVCTPGFDATAFFGWLKEFRPTWYTAVPAIHQAVLSAAGGDELNSQQRSLQLIRSASSTLPPNVTDKLEALFCAPVIDTYGMTEAASQIAANPPGRRKPGSVGKPAGAEIAIIDGTGRRLPTGKRGEITLRGPTITRGYDNDSSGTDAAFRDGWFRTGDLGYLDRDGYLFIVGRTKEIINRGGQKIAPMEVDQALLSHPDVVEAAAFSIVHPRLGEDVAAAVVLRRNSMVRTQDLQIFASKRLARYKVPSLICIVPEIPKGPAGKIKRSELGTLLSITLPAEQAERESAIVPPRSELEWQLATIWQDLLGGNHIGIDDDVFALGADSITVTRMLSRLQSRFGVDFSFQDIFDAPTVKALAARLKSSESDSTVSASSRDRPTDITRLDEDGPQPVSIVQEHALRIVHECPELPWFNLSFAYRLKGPVNAPALERSLAEVVRRHHSLRTRFAWLGDRPIALIVPATDLSSLLVVEDLAAKASARAGQAKAPLLLKRAKLKAEQDALTPFDTTRAPLFRARLMQLGADEFRFNSDF